MFIVYVMALIEALLGFVFLARADTNSVGGGGMGIIGSYALYASVFAFYFAIKDGVKADPFRESCLRQARRYKAMPPSKRPIRMTHPSEAILARGGVSRLANNK